MGIERWDGSTQVPAASGPAMALAAGDVVDCSLTRAGWTVSATASNRANAQVFQHLDRILPGRRIDCADHFADLPLSVGRHGLCE